MTFYCSGFHVALVFQLDKVDKKTPMPRNVQDPLLKDTFMVPSKGYGIIRFVADNPGYWLAHCHMEAHGELGMSFVMKVGEHKDILDPLRVELMETDVSESLL